MRLDELDAVAWQHHGVVTRAMTGLSDQAWRRTIRNGTLVRLYPGVARLAGTDDSVEQRIIAAVFGGRTRCDGIPPLVGVPLGRSST